MSVFSVRRLTFGAALFLDFLALTSVASAVSPNVVISQVYGGGGNTGAPYNSDFIEIFNRGASSVSLSGYSVQYASATGTGNFAANPVTALSGTLAPGQYYLIKQSGGATGAALPTPDATGTVNMSATGGKVALVNSTSGLACNGGSTPCSAAQLALIVDLVGYGTANFFEGAAAAPAASNTTAVFRALGGCTDTDNNSADFTAATPSPRNTASTFNVCAVTTNPSGVGAADPSVVEPGDTTVLTVTVTPGTNPASTGITVTGDLSSVGGSAAQTFFDNATNGDATAGDNIFSFQATVAIGTQGGPKTLPVSITDAQARSGSAEIELSLPAEIWEIQGSGAASPFAGNFVVTRNNVVTALDTNGFFIQTPDVRGDGSGETSNGIFVFTSSAPTVAIGDQVDVQGTVVEFFNLTEFNNVGLSVSVDSTGNSLPAFQALGPGTPSAVPETPHDLERFEGMLVRVENALANGPADQFGDVPIVAGTARVFREPGILYPGLPGLPVFDGNPEVFDLAPNGLLLPVADIPGGASIELAEGPLSFAFGDYSLLAKTLSWSGAAAVSPVRDRNQGEWTVGTQNLLRLFDTVNDPGVSDEVATPAEYADRLNKFSQHIRLALKSPDVLVVQEVEKLAVLQDLAARILADDSTVAYTPYLLEGNDVGGIDIGFLVRGTIDVDSVTQFGAADTFTFNSVTAILNDRPPLVLQGSYVSAPGAIPFPITVIGVHQRSLGGIEDPADGPRVREKRHQQALRLSQYVQSLQAANSNVRLVVLGDFNAFEFTDGYVDVMGQVTGNPDPLGALVPATDEVDPNLTNQTLNMPADERYSFVFDGSAQSLDHVVTSSQLNPWVRSSEHSRGNADAPFTFEDDPTTSLRSSDHDGTVLFLTADSDGDGFADDVDACDLSSSNTTVVIDGCDSGAENDLFANGCKITDTIEACAAAAVTHEDFTACVTQAMNTLKNNGAITNKERGAIQKCAGQADIP